MGCNQSKIKHEAKKVESRVRNTPYYATQRVSPDVAAAEPKEIPAKIKAMAGLTKGLVVTEWQYDVKPLGRRDADFYVTYNGVCGSDLHMLQDEWGMSHYPIVPGHEVVGHVLRVGEGVKDLKVGDVVGLGALCQACGSCALCNKNLDNLCPDRVFTYFAKTKDETGEHQHYGGFSSFLRTDSRLLFKIPEGIPEAVVGPLMCGGLTVAAPLMDFNGMDKDPFNGKGKKLGVIGIGGLGHLALKFAAAMGFETIAVSRGTAKRDFAIEMGAKALLDHNDAAAMKEAAGTFDYLMVAIAGGSLDVEKFASLLKPYGHLHFVGLPEEDLKFPIKALLFQRLTLSGSPIGSSLQMKKMLQFAAKHKIAPIVEEFPHSKANDAIQKVHDGTIRFRAVLKNDLA